MNFSFITLSIIEIIELYLKINAHILSNYITRPKWNTLQLRGFCV